MYNYDRRLTGKGRNHFSVGDLNIGRDERENNLKLDSSSLSGHMLILGKSGTGKSNMMLNLMNRIREQRKCNIVLLDPHGTLSDSVIMMNDSMNNVFISPGILDLDGEKRVVSFNAISGDRDDQMQVDRSTGWIRDMLAGDSAFSQGSWGPRLEVLFKVVLAEVMRRNEHATLLEFVSIITSKKDMKKFMEAVPDPAIKRFLESQYGDWRNWTQYISSTMNRLLPLLSSPATRYLISGETDSFDLCDSLLSEDSIFTLNISRSSFSEEAIRIISSLFLLKMWTSLMDKRISSDHVPETYVFIDEFQLIPGSIVQNLLSEGRKFGIRVILASQYLHTDKRQELESIFGNIRNYVCFSLSDTDATHISGMLPEVGEVRKFKETVKGQRLHNAVLMSHDDMGFKGTVSFMPNHISPMLDPNRINTAKAESIRRYGTVLSDEPNGRIKKEPLSLHERIIDDFEALLEKRGIQLDRSRKINTSYPDGTFVFNGTEYLVEVEVSDVLSKYRVVSKLKRYPGRNLIVITERGNGRIIHDYMISPTRFRSKNNLILELPLLSGSSEIYARDVAPELERTLLVEYNEGEFKSYWSGSTRRFLLKHLAGPSTFSMELSSGEWPDVRQYIFRNMVESGTYAVKKRDIVTNGLIKTNLAERFINKNADNKSDFIFLKDLFQTD